MNRVWSLLRWLVLNEVRSYAGAARFFARRPDVPPDAQPIRYVGADAALLWGFTVVSAVELVAVHLIVPWETVRLVADVIGIWGVLWCLGFTACHYVYPHLLEAGHLSVRSRMRPPVARIALDNIARVSYRERGLDSSTALQLVDDALCVVAGSRTNVEIRLHSSITVTVRGVEHEVQEVRMFADEAREAASLVRATLSSGERGPI